MADSPIETPEKHADDEALSEQLERHLDLLMTGTTGTTTVSAPTDSAELRRLQDLVGKLHQFADFLAVTSSSVAESGLAPSNETADFHGSENSFTGLSSTGRPPPVAAPTLPTHIGKYEVVRSLGQGGQGSALLVFDPYLRRHAVVKRYHGASCEQTCRVFLAEGQALARVRSPYVALVHSAEEENDHPYLVVEYIRGRSLAEVLASRRLPIDESLRLMRQLAEGLSAIHACGLLHRDIKPSNIIVGDDGVPRLVDFGLAARLASDELRGISGTFPYMAPEQARGESDRIDPRTDLFGLGAVFYEMLTGRAPYVGTSRRELLQAAQQGDIVPPRERRSDLSAGVNDLCMRCLAKDPNQRFGSAQEFVQALDQLKQRRQRVAAFHASWPRAAVAGLLVATLSVAIVTPVIFLQLGKEPPSKRSHELAQVEFSKRDRTFADKAPAIASKGPENRIESKKMDVVQVPANPITPMDPPAPAFPLTTPATMVGAALPLASRKDFPIRVTFVDQKADAKGRFELTAGEPISIAVEVDRPAYVGVWHVDDAGRVVQLFPSRADADHLIKPGTKRVIPGDKRYRIMATPSTAMEHLRVVASTKPWALKEGQRAGPEGVYSFFATAEEKNHWESGVRGLVLTPLPMATPEWAVSELIVPFQVRPKKIDPPQ